MKYKSLTFLGVTLTLLLSYNFLSAAWSAPSGTPPSNNTDAPINVGATLQTKSGTIGSTEFRTNRYCDAAGANCFSATDVGGPNNFLNTGSSSQTKTGVLGMYGLMVEGASTIAAASPRIKYDDTDAGAIDFWTYLDGNTFTVRADRNNDGSASDSPHPMRLFTSASSTGDYVAFANKVRATEYCDENGQNCVDASSQVGNSSATQVQAGEESATLTRTGNGDGIDHNTKYSYSYAVTYAEPFTTTPILIIHSNDVNCPYSITGSSATGFGVRTATYDDYGNTSASNFCSEKFSWIAAPVTQ